MTPERAAFHRLMLICGLQEKYEQELDHALETEEPLSDLVLELTSCLSDIKETISVLGHYMERHGVDEQKVYDMVVEELRQLYIAGKLDALQICRVMNKILGICEFEEPWIGLYRYLYEYELLDEGIISGEVFEMGFAALFLHGVQLDTSALEKEKRRKSFLCLLRRWEERRMKHDRDQRFT